MSMTSRDEMTRDDFDLKVIESFSVHPEWRYGQTLFNVLCVVRPDLAERVRGTEYDPFHRRPVDTNAFVDFLDLYWPRV